MQPKLTLDPESNLTFRRLIAAARSCTGQCPSPPYCILFSPPAPSLHTLFSDVLRVARWGVTVCRRARWLRPDLDEDQRRRLSDKNVERREKLSINLLELMSTATTAFTSVDTKTTTRNPRHSILMWRERKILSVPYCRLNKGQWGE